MKGYEVVTSDGQRIGRVADRIGGFLVVELGRLLRTRLALPREFVHVTDCDRRVVVTVPRALLQAAPESPVTESSTPAPCRATSASSEGAT